MKGFEPGARVRVTARDDEYTGQIGTVQRVLSDRDGAIYRVDFGEPYQTAYYRPDDLASA